MRWLRPRHQATAAARRLYSNNATLSFVSNSRLVHRYSTKSPTESLKEEPSNPNQDPSPPSSSEEKPISKSSLDLLGHTLSTDFATFRTHYDTPKHPIVLAHGLLGFDELRLAGRWLPGVQYWRGIQEALTARGAQVITTSVPTTGSIQERASALHTQIARKVPPGGHVNIVAHSMGGLDARWLISRIQPRPGEYRVRSLTTVATPHRGSAAADWILREIGETQVQRLYRVLTRLRIDSGAFAQLTRRYVVEKFNPEVVDSEEVRYFSYGASATPSVFSVFRLSHDIMMEIEGPNDGLVSVASSKWGEKHDGYKGTLMGVTHLDLINWTNRLKKLAADMTLMKQDFNAVAFYLAIADMLAKEGL